VRSPEADIPGVPKLRDFALIAVAVWAVFGQTVGFHFVPYDDPAFITGNPQVARGLTPQGIVWAFTYWRAGDSLPHPGVENLWHPLTWMSHMLDAGIFGVRQAGGHHFTSVLLHMGAAWMVCLFAGRLTASRTAGVVTALLFALHPLRVESVAWVSERKDVLSGVLFFACLWLVLEGRRRAAFCAFAAALMAKPSTVVLPVMVILIQGWMAGETAWGLKFWRQRILEWRWWFAASAVGALLAIWFQDQGSHAPLMENLPFGYRLLHLAGGMLFTIWHTILPVNLSFHYAYPQGPLWLPLIAWVLVLVTAAAVWLGRKKYPGLFFAAAWFAVCWMPSSGLLYVGTSFTADRYTYLALTGAFAMFGLWVAGGRPAAFPLRKILAGALILLLAVMSWKQCAVWRDGAALFSQAAVAQPRNPVVLVNLGGLHQQAGRHEEAIKLFRRTLEIAPQDARAWYNLGNSLRDTGKAGEAIIAFRQAVAFGPQSAGTWRNLGLMLAAQGLPQRDPEGARAAFAEACRLTSHRDPVPLLLLAEVEFELGNIPATKALLAELQILRPQDPKVDRAMNELRRKLP
jgi:hypothetical protein